MYDGVEDFVFGVSIRLYIYFFCNFLEKRDENRYIRVNRRKNFLDV